MGRRRYISSDISVDKDVKHLAMKAGDFAALLYTWMIPHADDYGILNGDPEELLDTVFPGRRDKTPEDVAEALDAMERLGLIERAGGKLAFPVDAFYRYQAYVSESRRRDCPLAEWLSRTGANQRKPAQTSAMRQTAPTSAQNRASLSLSLSHSLSTTPTQNQEDVAPSEGVSIKAKTTDPDRIPPADAAGGPDVSEHGSEQATASEKAPVKRRRKASAVKNASMADPDTRRVVGEISEAMTAAGITARPGDWYPRMCHVVHGLLQGAKVTPELASKAAVWALEPYRRRFFVGKLLAPARYPEVVAACQAGDGGPPTTGRSERRSRYRTPEELGLMPSSLPSPGPGPPDGSTSGKARLVAIRGGRGPGGI